MNKYSYKQENQDAFGVWFDSIPADKKQEYLDRLNAGDFGQWAYDALKDGDQDSAWCDALHDSLYTWGEEAGLVYNKTGYEFDLNLSTPLYAVEIDTKECYGYFQNNNTGTEGGLWFDGLTLVDYDGVTELPKPVHSALVAAGFDLSDIDQ